MNPTDVEVAYFAAWGLGIFALLVFLFRRWL